MSDKIFEPLEPQGFIGEYSKFITSRVPTSKDWAESVAIAMLSTCCRPDRIIRTKIGKLRLNLFHLVIGPSGLSYKTVPLKDYCLPTMLEVSKKLKYNTILPSGFSIEGMIEYLDKVQNVGIIIRDEFTTLFKEFYHKKYLSDEMEFLSQLYDGLMQMRYTRRAKLDHVVSCYVNLLATTTPYLYRVMKPDFFIQGIGNRILYTLFDGNDVPKCSFEELFPLPESDELDDKIALFAESLAKIWKEGNPLRIHPNKAAGKLLAEFKYKMESEAMQRQRKDPYDLQYSYLHRLPEMTIKLAGVHSISRCYKEEFRAVHVLNEYDAKWAIAKAERHLEYFREMLNRWAMVTVEEPVRTQRPDFEYAKLVLSRLGGKATHTQVIRYTGWSGDKVRNVMNTLSQAKVIKIYKGESSAKGGPKPVIYELIEGVS